MRRKMPARISCGRSTVLLEAGSGTLLHHLRLGVKGEEINVLGRNTQEPARPSTALLASFAGIVVIALGADSLRYFPVASAAESCAGGESPLALCWKTASSRMALAPCLEKLLADARRRLSIAQSRVAGEAAELDRVTRYRSKNVARTRASDEHWRAYRDAECDRQAEAMSPGTGSGDMYLACRITLTNARVKQLATP
jgi:uncharacterized protein YecT (DUF1311 family)